jgi:hypothetical protein
VCICVFVYIKILLCVNIGLTGKIEEKISIKIIQIGMQCVQYDHIWLHLLRDTTLKDKKIIVILFFSFLQFLLVFVRIYDFLSALDASCRLLTLLVANLWRPGDGGEVRKKY